jgi:hypothetical protein
MNYVTKDGKRYFNRQGRLIELVPEEPRSGEQRASRRRRKPFETRFVQIPKKWITTLSQTKSSGTTWRLAMVILDKEFERQHTGKEIVLSAQVTRMSQTTRRRATQELVSLGLIQLKPGSGRNAPKVLTVRGGLRAPNLAT